MVPEWLISRLLFFPWCFSVSHLKLALCLKKYATVIRNPEKTVLTLSDAVSDAQIVPSLPYSSLYLTQLHLAWSPLLGGLQSVGLWRVGYDWATSLSLFTFLHWRRKWQPSPVFLPRESQGRGSHRLGSMGPHRVRHDWRDLAAAAAVIAKSMDS